MSIDWSSEAADVRDGSCSIEEVVSVSEAPRMGVTQKNGIWHFFVWISVRDAEGIGFGKHSTRSGGCEEVVGRVGRFFNRWD